MPEEDKETFDILAKGEIISNELAIKLKDAKGMRNILSHQYGKVDDKIVFESLKEQLIRNIEEFIQQIKKFLIFLFGFHPWPLLLCMKEQSHRTYLCNGIPSIGRQQTANHIPYSLKFQG